MSEDMGLELEQDLERECALENPVLPYLRQERIPHIWCPGCGIGTSPGP
jgi:hypothetical protein